VSASTAVPQAASNWKARLPRKLSIRRSKVAAVVLALLLRILIDLSYVTIVQPLFAYAGYTLRVDWTNLGLSYVLVIAMGFLLPSKKQFPSADITFIIFAIAYLPCTSFFALQAGDPRYFVLFNLAFLVLCTTVAFVPCFRVPLNISHRLTLLLAITLVCTLYAVATVVMRGGLSLLSLDITRVYEFRSEINSRILTGLVGYDVEWVSKVFIPAMLVFGLWTNRKLVILGAILLAVAFFAITSAKGVLFYPILTLIAYFGKLSGNFRIGFLLAAIAVPILSFITYFALHDILVTGILLNRIYFVPTIANFQYYDFFRVHPLVYWSNTFMSFFYENPYNDTIAVILGRSTNVQETDTYLNVGIFATGYMQFGVLGMLLFPLFAGLSLKVIDGLTVNRMPTHVALSVSVVAGIQYLSADFT